MKPILSAHTSEEFKRLTAAFPGEIASEVKVVLGGVPLGLYPPSEDDIGSVSIRGEAVVIPARIYSPEPNSTSSLSDVQRTILACLYTRHYDGFVREKQLPALFAAQFPWVPPYVLQLVGEYVVEIIETIAKQIEELDLALCSEFAEENPAFISVTRSRVISYWDCYYRQRYPKLRDYPGYRVMSVLNLWSGRDARHILKHQQ